MVGLHNELIEKDMEILALQKKVTTANANSNSSQFNENEYNLKVQINQLKEELDMAKRSYESLKQNGDHSKAFHNLNYLTRASSDQDNEDLKSQISYLLKEIGQKNELISELQNNLNMCNELAFQVAQTMEDLGAKCKKSEETSNYYKNTEKDWARQIEILNEAVSQGKKNNKLLGIENDRLKQELNQFSDNIHKFEAFEYDNKYNSVPKGYKTQIGRAHV